MSPGHVWILLSGQIIPENILMHTKIISYTERTHSSQIHSQLSVNL